MNHFFLHLSSPAHVIGMYYNSGHDMSCVIQKVSEAGRGSSLVTCFEYSRYQDYDDYQYFYDRGYNSNAPILDHDQATLLAGLVEEIDAGQLACTTETDVAALMFVKATFGYDLLVHYLHKIRNTMLQLWIRNRYKRIAQASTALKSL